MSFGRERDLKKRIFHFEYYFFSLSPAILERKRTKNEGPLEIEEEEEDDNDDDGGKKAGGGGVCIFLLLS